MATVVDDFNRANSTTSLGTATSGQAWSNVLGDNFGIDTNEAYVHNPSQATFTNFAGVPKHVAVIDSGRSNQDINVRVDPSPTSPNFGIVARYVDANNFLFVFFRNTSSEAVEVYKRVAGTYTQIAVDSAWSQPSGVLDCRFAMRGADWFVTCELVPILSGTFTSGEQAVFGSATKAGLILLTGKFAGTLPNDPGDTRFDDFRVGQLGGRRGLGMIRG
jgi:hypothetical protein